MVATAGLPCHLQLHNTILYIVLTADVYYICEAALIKDYMIFLGLPAVCMGMPVAWLLNALKGLLILTTNTDRETKESRCFNPFTGMG